MTITPLMQYNELVYSAKDTRTKNWAYPNIRDDIVRHESPIQRNKKSRVSFVWILPRNCKTNPPNHLQTLPFYNLLLWKKGSLPYCWYMSFDKNSISSKLTFFAVKHLNQIRINIVAKLKLLHSYSIHSITALHFSWHFVKEKRILQDESFD